MNKVNKADMTVKEYIQARTHGKAAPLRQGSNNAERAGMSIKDYIRAKAKGETK